MLSCSYHKGKVTFNLPSCIEAGQYLLRVEIIGNSLYCYFVIFEAQQVYFLDSVACRKLVPRCPVLRAETLTHI